MSVESSCASMASRVLSFPGQSVGATASGKGWDLPTARTPRAVLHGGTFTFCTLKCERKKIYQLWDGGMFFFFFFPRLFFFPRFCFMLASTIVLDRLKLLLTAYWCSERENWNWQVTGCIFISLLFTGNEAVKRSMKHVHKTDEPLVYLKTGNSQCEEEQQKFKLSV